MTQYLLSVYETDDAPLPDAHGQAMQDVQKWLGEVSDAGSWVFGAGLNPAASATVLSTQDEELVISDGPFVEGKEHIAGFTIIDVPGRDAAFDWARKLAQARRATVEVSEMRGGETDAVRIPSVQPGMKAYLMSIYQPDGPPPPPEFLDPIMNEVGAWKDELKAANAWVFDAGLAPASEAKVFRPGEGDVIVTDGPYVEGKEHLGGFTILQAPDLDAALEWVSKLVLVRYLPLEVRPMVTGSG